MNLIWDILLRARRGGKNDSDLFFRQAEWCSPWYEQSFVCLNQSEVEEDIVEINALYRFADIFQAFLHEDITDFPEFQSHLFDAAIHLLAEIDLHHGLSKREFYIRKLTLEILEGAFGPSAAEHFGAVPADRQDRMAALVLSQLQTGASLVIFRKAVLVQFPDAMIYQVRADPKQILLYVGVAESKRLGLSAAFLQEMFLPVSYRLRIFWAHHFGVIGVDATMHMDGIEIY